MRFAKRWNQALRSNAPGRKYVLLASLCVMAIILLPTRVQGQFGLDPCCAIISAGLNTVSNLLKSVVAQPLSSIHQMEQQAVTFEQQVVYPVTAINNARNTATQLQSSLRQMTQLSRLPVNSATLPVPQQLEQVLLSHNPQLIAQVGQNYTALYGRVMSADDAPQQIRDVVDATDAEAQAALKRAMELDALIDIELAAADQLNQQIRNAAPGSAPILEAEAAAWNVRANAHTQAALAELMRLRSTDLANSSARIKFSASSTATMRNTTNQVLGTTPK
jgi:hypothetical protein